MDVKHFRKLRSLIEEADELGLLKEARGLAGFSGRKLTGALQRIARYQEHRGAGRYLEVGVFQGLTLISVASVLDGRPAYGIDNFSQFDPRGVNEGIVKERARLNGCENVRLIGVDYEDALEDLRTHIGDAEIGTYFVDGPHDYRSQLVSLLLAKRYLSDSAVILVDDCNYRHVRLASRDFLLASPDFKLLFESYTKCHPSNMDREQERQAREGWWNGVNVIVRDPGNDLSPMLPQTFRGRRLHENEHLVHGAMYGVLAPEAVVLVRSILSFRLLTAWRQLRTLARELRQMDEALVGTYESMNTYSNGLPQARFNSALD